MLLPDPRRSDIPDIDRFGGHLPSPDEASLGRLLRRIALIVAVLLLAFTLINAHARHLLQTPVLALGAVGFALLGRSRSRLDNSRLATSLAFGLTLLVSLMILISGEGIRDSAAMAYPGILILASLTVSSLEFVVIAAAICATAVGLGMLELHQLRALAFVPAPNRSHLLDILLILTGTAMVARLLAHHLLSQLHRSHWQALIDPLVGLPNRRALEARAGAFLAEARAAGQRTTAIALHIDRIEHVNRTFGHTLGDGALHGLAAEMKALIGGDCLIVRYGGNTFLGLLRHPAASDAAGELARHLLALTHRERTIGGVVIRLDGSCGTRTDRGAPDDAERLIEDAFIALDSAMKQGGGKMLEYSDEFGERVRGEFLIESSLRSAIDSGRVEMHYQPILSHPGGCVIALEALLRLHAADGRALPALPAIELAEASGLIHRLGEVVIASVFADIQRWRQAGAQHLPVSVNFSGLQLSRPDFSATLLAHLRRHALPGHALILEITETEAISGTPNLTGALAELAEAGVMIALDDFGAGHSSLHRLREIPADIIKFDRSLIEGIGESESARQFLRKTVDLVRVAHPFILFEGIDDPRQAAQIPALGCRAVQGNWYARPLAADVVPAYLASHPLGDDLQPTRQCA